MKICDDCWSFIGLNKGEAHHALKNALRIGRQGEIRDHTTEGQHFRIAGLNLLTALFCTDPESTPSWWPWKPLVAFHQPLDLPLAVCRNL